MTDIERLKTTLDFLKWKYDLDMKKAPNDGDERILTKTYEEHKKAFETALTVLEKQIPKKPNMIGFEPNKLISSVHYSCPICDRLLSRYKYCPDCGQALDWSDTE